MSTRATGRLGKEFEYYPQANYLRSCLYSASKVDVQALITKGFTGEVLGIEINQQRIKLIKRVKLSEPFVSES